MFDNRNTYHAIARLARHLESAIYTLPRPVRRSRLCRTLAWYACSRVESWAYARSARLPRPPWDQTPEPY